ncbi:LuxR family two component transcriptional regulator [Saccharothrix australiensis]|uniref:LuxR family two component transcriptional regulator n=1 Tax=Saccharothrix australiensis TaxID=2072 RepID=A0A495W1G1_9PSEU|nr:LuxR family two component transcriptional regulator [Saccharothrix australiensis]
MIRVLVADDHPVVRHGLRGMIEAEDDLEVVGEAASGAEAVAVVDARAPDVVLMDLRMPDGDGLWATGRVRTGHPACRVLVLTTYDTDTDITRAIEAGASGYLLKDCSQGELVDAVRAVHAGHTPLTPSVATALANRMRTPAHARLSEREVQILRLVAKGLSNADIGRELHIGAATVKSHLLRTFAKLGVNDRTAAVAAAVRRGHGVLDGVVPDGVVSNAPRTPPPGRCGTPATGRPDSDSSLVDRRG